ncbi:MAG TPA: hypothetical protein VGP72_25155 [Planctomycetota bacterium]|jgi:hypothetical protein
MRLITGVVCSLVVLSGAVRAAETYEKWAEQNADAKKKFVTVLVAHKNFREAFESTASDKAEVTKSLVKFLAEKKEHSVVGFAEKHGKDAREWRKCADTYPDQIKTFHEWVQDYSAAATTLAGVNDGFKSLCKDAEKEADEAKSANKKSKK